MLTRKCDICGAEMRMTTPRYKVIFDGWLYTKEKDICIDCFERITDEIRQAEPTISKMEQVDKDINVRSKDEPQLVKESVEVAKDLVKAFCEDGTWLERQGVYTLTLAEAKQRAVDIIESVLAKDEQSGKE